MTRSFQEAGCNIEKIVGKNIFSGVAGEDRLKDPKVFDGVLRLELTYCDDPYLIGCAGHIAVVCRKQR